MAARNWTAADIPNQTGRTVVVTGANSGLGFVAARELAAAGAHTVLACRDHDRSVAAVDRIRRRVPDADVHVASLDLADLASVRRFAADLPFAALDVLINNAGVMALPLRHTVDGFEMQFGTNHLGHFALTGLLLPRLLAAGQPRVVTVSSNLHRLGRMTFDNLHGERRYARWRAYGRTKLANLLFTAELQRRAAGTALRSMAAHPGSAATDLQTAGPRMAGDRMIERAAALGNRFFAQSAELGALPELYAATVPDLPGDSYIGPDGWFERGGYPRPVGRSAAARDLRSAARLWRISQDLTGVRYDFG